MCAVDHKRPFFPRAGPFLAFLPFKEAYGKAGPLTERDDPYGKGRSLRESPLRGWLPLPKKDGLWEATGRDVTRIGREFPLVRRRPKKTVFS